MEQTDSLTVEEHEDGGMTISWDKNDPKYSWMNDLTEEEVQGIISRALDELIQNE
jgi:hypothetical protein